MLKIGDFAKTAKVTVKTLRFYAHEGLLAPVLVDRFNGYRYYTLDQLPLLNRILALKDLGFSLEQIRKLLNESISPKELRGMLRLKQAELHDRLQLEKEKLERVEFRLRQIESEGPESLNDIVVCRSRPVHKKEEIKMEPVKFETLPAFKVMDMKYHGNNANLEISQMWGRLNKRTHEIPIVGDGAYGVCYTLNDAPKGVFEYVAGFKVEDVKHIPEGMVVVDVPENHYAVFAHKGSLATLGQTYHEICDVWFPQAKYKPTGGYDMEVYNEEFKDFAPDSVFYIYEPIK